jgi:hypothetical protein
MKPKATLKTICHAGIKNDPTPIGHHVDIECLHFDWGIPRFARDDTRFAGVDARTFLDCHPERSEGSLTGW